MRFLRLLSSMRAGLELLEVSVVVFLLQGYLVTGNEVSTWSSMQRNDPDSNDSKRFPQLCPASVSHLDLHCL